MKLQFNIGDRVILKSGTCYKRGYKLGSSNPEVGSEYYCVGTITSSGMVDWDNHTSNSYSYGDLEHIIESFINLNRDFDDLLESI